MAIDWRISPAQRAHSFFRALIRTFTVSSLCWGDIFCGIASTALHATSISSAWRASLSSSNESAQVSENDPRKQREEIRKEIKNEVTFEIIAISLGSLNR